MRNRLGTGSERRRQAAAIEQWDLGCGPTGPRTTEGKTAASRNGWKGGLPVVACRGAIEGARTVIGQKRLSPDGDHTRWPRHNAASGPAGSCNYKAPDGRPRMSRLLSTGPHRRSNG